MNRRKFIVNTGLLTCGASITTGDLFAREKPCKKQHAALKDHRIDKVMNNCQWDYDHGYRQLKVKIGRGGKWYPHDEGLATDIKIVNMIHEEFGGKGVEILVDANDKYSLQDTIDFLQGVKDVPIYWVEEPFREELKKSRALKKWMMANGREKTYYGDGENKPDYDLVKKMIIEDTLDMHLTDIVNYGFTKWRKLMPFLREHKAVASPHAWGYMLKTHYISHLSAGLGNVATIEGVTCLSDDIDFGDYKIADGKLHVSSKPGFGMKLLI
jgi:D-galactarolactone cycloisomerase